MRRFSKTLFLTTAALVVSSGIASANPKADANNDGIISKAEFTALASANFIKTDTNADGVLTQDEMRAGKQRNTAERAEKRFSDQDLNGDGFISKSEYETKRAERGDKMKSRRDLNNDGTVDEADSELRKTKRQERQANRGDRAGKRGVNRDNHRKHIKRDANGDGVITRAEFDTATEAMFIRLDANADGVLTKGEGKKRGKKRKNRR